jgi:hypothetical protein
MQTIPGSTLAHVASQQRGMNEVSEARSTCVELQMRLTLRVSLVGQINLNCSEDVGFGKKELTRLADATGDTGVLTVLSEGKMTGLRSRWKRLELKWDFVSSFLFASLQGAYPRS